MTRPAAPPRSTLKHVRLLLWLLVGIALIGTAALFVMHQASKPPAVTQTKSGFGGPFTLIGADGKPFSSTSLIGKPYAIYFGFTRCGDVCPTTLQRLVRLRRAAGSDVSMNILFVTVDPAHDGPKEVGQYAALFSAPIIGLTGSPAQIEQVKKQFGIYAQPVPNAPMGKQMAHSATVLLFDRGDRFVGTISPNEPDSSAIETLKQLLA